MEKTPRHYKNRVNFFFLIIIGLMSLILVRLFYLQIIKVDEYRQIGERRSLKVEKFRALRGRIVDRNNKVLVDDRAAYHVGIVQNELRKTNERRRYDEIFEFDQVKLDTTVKNLSLLLKIDKNIVKKTITEELVEITNRDWKGETRDNAVPMFEEISKDEAFLIATNSNLFPGAQIVTAPTRKYLWNKTASHIFGRTGKINNEIWNEVKEKGYHPTDTIGLEGLELQYEDHLRGKWGKRIKKYTSNRTYEETSYLPPERGENLKLTIDIELQANSELALEATIKDLRERELAYPDGGVAIAMNPKNGEILAMVSYPSYNANTYTKNYNELLADPLKPLYDKALKGAYPPGSVFKPFIACTALQTFSPNKFNSNSHFTCNHTYSLDSGRTSFRCLGNHGSIPLQEAIKRSCNIYFYNVAKKLKTEPISKWALLFGFGEPTGIDLPGEISGNIPLHGKSAENKYYMGTIVQFGIGQGDITVTPLQVAKAVSALANGGKVMIPHLVSDPNKEKPEKVINLQDSTIKTVHEAMRRVVHEPGGTGYRAFKGSKLLEKINVAGKTGSATGRDARGSYTHGWFISFAPLEDPEIVVVVIVERGASGGGAAAPVARKILEHYFKNVIE